MNIFLFDLDVLGFRPGVSFQQTLILCGCIDLAGTSGCGCHETEVLEFMGALSWVVINFTKRVKQETPHDATCNKIGKAPLGTINQMVTCYMREANYIPGGKLRGELLTEAHDMKWARHQGECLDLLFSHKKMYKHMSNHAW